MRDPIKVIRHRASKIPEIQNFIDNIQNHQLADIETLTIKRSDKKLLRTHFDRLQKHNQQELLNELLLAAIESMPTNNAREIYQVMIYDGIDTTYDGLEVPTGTVITEHDDWIRFDFFRVKKKKNTSEILSQCRTVAESMNIDETNAFIHKTINDRHNSNYSPYDYTQSIRIV